MTSIRLRLLKWLIVPILLINLAGGALAYMLAWLPAQIAFDQSVTEAPARAQAGGGEAMPAPAGRIAVDQTPHQRTQIRQAVVRALVLLEVLIALACVCLLYTSPSPRD